MKSFDANDITLVIANYCIFKEEYLLPLLNKDQSIQSVVVYNDE